VAAACAAAAPAARVAVRVVHQPLFITSMGLAMKYGEFLSLAYRFTFAGGRSPLFLKSVWKICTKILLTL
jgi:hypothetical protein